MSYFIFGSGARIQEKRDSNPKEDVVSKYESKVDHFGDPFAFGSRNLAFHLWRI